MASGSIPEFVTRNHPSSPSPTIPAAVLKEIKDAGVPFYMAGIFVPHAVCTLFVFSRIVCRIWIIRKWFLDDTLIFLSWLFSTALCVVYAITAQTPSLLGAPSDGASSVLDANPYIMRTYLGLIYYQLCLCLTKLSILTFYLRVFACRPRERFLARAAIVFVFLYSAPMLLMSFLQCHPGPGLFFGQPMMCFEFPDLLISSASLHSATDAWLIIMVIPCVTRLDIPHRQKVALGVVMSLGIFVIVASMVRLQLSLHLQYRPNSAAIRNTLGFFVMTVLECDIALICASAPTLRPLVANLFSRWMSSAQRRRSLEAPTTQSFDLTSLTYNGYPWAGPGSPAAQSSRNGSVRSHPGKPRMPAPPGRVLSMTHRAPTTLSLGNMIIGTAPRVAQRTRARPLEDDGSKPMLHETWEAKRSSSIYSQDPAWDELGEGNYERRGVVLKTMRLSLSSEHATEVGDLELGKAGQLDVNRMSPMSGLSGETWIGDRISSATKTGSINGKLTTEIPSEKEVGVEAETEADSKPEVPMRNPLRDNRR
ncbi:putative integral membrane protein [Colletotrichum sublineola]|uniref:Putative integral membrane protein n=1 Tax=Colletotrichum sublineola TaxID=1173701 RepID=A0A066X6L7_COLSU|nr:putative integral membrane protein [Colletotrichum sublineola]